MWKLPYIKPIFFSKILFKKKSIKLMVRNSIIPKNYSLKSLYVYNGKKYMPVITKTEMAGFKLGEFSFTRTAGQKKKLKKTKKKNK